ncbi:MAG: hypothetical protein WC455_15125 [Dehalococcoidia bacterium]
MSDDTLSDDPLSTFAMARGMAKIIGTSLFWDVPGSGLKIRRAWAVPPIDKEFFAQVWITFPEGSCDVRR